MLKPALAVVVLACLANPGAAATELDPGLGPGLDPGQDETARVPARVIVVRGHDGDVLARVPLHGERFAVSYRNSIYGTLAEERYEILPDGRFRLVQLAADQVAVLEEYYAVPGAPRRAPGPDPREWTVPPDPARPAVFETLSIAATDLGERTVHVPGEPPLQLWRLVEDAEPFVVLDAEENP